MVDIDSFLKECVFYPCSALHGVPVKFLGKCFQRFLYVDYRIKRVDFEQSIEEGGFKGYRQSVVDEISPETLFGMSWDGVRESHRVSLSQIPFEWSEPFVVLSRFERSPGYDDAHGPATFELMFVCCEAISTFISVFFRRNIVPRCLVHIRSGIGCGGNFSEYPYELNQALVENEGGLPPFIFYDFMGSSRDCGDYLDIIEKYETVEKWGYPDGGFLKLAKKNIGVDLNLKTVT
jgi:hypothetical protein